MWLMNGSQILANPIVSLVPTDWTIAGVGDFNADGMSDILWRESGGSVAAWLMNGKIVSNSPLVGMAATNWTVQAMGPN